MDAVMMNGVAKMKDVSKDDETVKDLGGDFKKKIVLNKDDDGFTLLYDEEDPLDPQEILEWRNRLRAKKKKEEEQVEVAYCPTEPGTGAKQKDVSASFTNLLEKADDTNDEDLEFSLDGGSTNNVSRFINHSCDPNLFLHCMLEEHHDPRLARVFLVASEDIPPLQGTSDLLF
ncbi:hypothetical protein POM88_047753 [Heracleum sosnowskyi]|uniref:SET domain-containing protein n=1 Tax=Heracleum sosnowskyi TaxID=360622 RepID=A0AAD8LZY5_9APIA|nr:hypothetical protein POM88_047753 [Heracleum sosnowskyi]